MQSISSNLTVSNASATGSGRSKVALKPGHSLLDWIRYTHSAKDLTSTGGKTIEVSSRELAKHNTKKDAWIALKGKVYNITPYFDYHPGGEEELMRGAGKDATDLFNQVHRWVNAETMLQRCCVGVLKTSCSLNVFKFPSVKPMKKPKNPKIIPESISPISPGDTKENLQSSEVFKWHIVSAPSGDSGELSIRFDKENNKIILKVTSTKIKYKELITDLTNENLFIKMNKESDKWLNIRLPSCVKNNLEVQVAKTKAEDNTIEFIFNGNGESCCNLSNTDFKWEFSDKSESIFWPCKLVKKVAVNYNTYLFTFLLPPNVKMLVPVGCHVFVKSEIEGVEVLRSYTPVVPSLEQNGVEKSMEQNDISSGSQIMLMIKIYPSGTFTPLLNMYNIGESILISNYVGTFCETLLRHSDSIVMLAAGTGITPMIGVIDWTLSERDKKRSLLLLFFNKTEEDILWKTEFDNCAKSCENFQVIHILSNSDQKWSGYTGSICEEILKELIPLKTSDNQFILICGPVPFTNIALRIMEKSGCKQENVYAFTG